MPAVLWFTFQSALLQCLITSFALFDPSYAQNDFSPQWAQLNNSYGSVLLSSFFYTAVCLRNNLLITAVLWSICWVFPNAGLCIVKTISKVKATSNKNTRSAITFYHCQTLSVMRTMPLSSPSLRWACLWLSSLILYFGLKQKCMTKLEKDFLPLYNRNSL